MFLFLVILFFIALAEIPNGWITLAITSIIWGWITFSIYDTDTNTEYRTDVTSIYSIGGNSSSTNGTFILGTGSIDSTEYYTYFVRNLDGSKERKKVQVRDTKIFEGNYEPRLEYSKCHAGSDYWWVSGMTSYKKDCNYFDKTILYLPENSVIQTFNIQ